jgi:carboxymethylenebutenolidase
MVTLTTETPSGPMALYEAGSPSPARGAAIIVLQEAFGVNAYVEAVADRLAEAGYLAVAPHLFHRSGDPVLPYGALDAVRPHMAALSERGLLEDLDATLDRLVALGCGPERVAAVGFCMGGSVAFLAAARRRLGAAVSFYGGGLAEGRFGMPSLIDLAPGLQTPWLGLYGDRDAGIPVEQVEALRAAAARAPVPTEIVRYPDAGHGFHCHERPAAYHEPSARDAWRRLLDWLAGRLAPA